MSEQIPVGTRVRWALAGDPPGDNEVGEVAELQEWDEASPADHTPGARTRVQWDSGIREWVFTSDLVRDR